MRTRWIIAAVVAAIGLVWIGQGLGIIGGSGFMIDDVRWAIAGFGLVAVGAAVGWTALRNRRRT
jgi:hypothetical protein